MGLFLILLFSTAIFAQSTKSLNPWPKEPEQFKGIHFGDSEAQVRRAAGEAIIGRCITNPFDESANKLCTLRIEIAGGDAIICQLSFAGDYLKRISGEFPSRD